MGPKKGRNGTKRWQKGSDCATVLYDSSHMSKTVLTRWVCHDCGRRVTFPENVLPHRHVVAAVWATELCSGRMVRDESWDLHGGASNRRNVPHYDPRRPFDYDPD